MSQNNKVVVNSAHPPGLTSLIFSRDGKYAYTGGADTLVRIWRTDQGSDQEPDAATEAGEAITTLACAGDCWLSGSADAEVRRYTSGMTDFQGLVTSANGVPIRSLAVDPRATRVAVCSDELSVKVIDLQDTIKIELLMGHTKGVRRASWHPSGSFLTTSSSDGTVNVWDVSEDTPKLTKTMEGVIPAVADAESPQYLHDCTVVWHPSGDFFVVASRSRQIVQISRDTWTKSGEFTSAALPAGPASALALSKNGAYLASAIAAGKEAFIAVWDVKGKKIVAQHTTPSDAVVTQIAWSPISNLIAWTDSEGVLTRWTDPVPSSLPSPVSSSPTAASSSKIRPAGPSLFDTDANTDGADEGAAGDIDLDDGDWIIDDLGGGLQDRDDDTYDADGKRVSGEGYVKEMVSVTKAQPPFQPGSTPMENKKCYLAYNLIGVIETTNQDTHHIVNVEFHDRSLRKGYHFTDHYKYTFASLGPRGALFACAPESSTHPTQVLYKPYGTTYSAAAASEWTYTLRPSRRVLGIAAGGPPLTSAFHDILGDGQVVIATDEGDLTFLGGGGTERRVMGLEGEFVSMVAGEEWVFVVCRAGATTIDGSQNLMGVVISLKDFKVLQRSMLPISRKHTLKWIGVTEEGAPAMYDSAGYVHVLDSHRSPLRGTWARVLDTNMLERRQGKDESYWPVGVSGEMFSCLILKGRQEHPGFPRPLIQELPMHMPFRRSDAKDASLEEHFQRDSLFLSIARPKLDMTSVAKREIALDKEIIQLIQSACKADRISRAIELTRLLYRTASIDLAVKVAQFYHLVGLQERMEQIKKEREHEVEEDGSDAEEEDWSRAGRTRRPGVGRPKPFTDFAPPPKVDRPGWRSATPVAVEGTRFTSRVAPQARAEVPPPSVSGTDTLSASKRKRDEEDLASLHHEEAHISQEQYALQDTSASAAPAPKAKLNPFARKHGQDMNGSSAPGFRNPFVRKVEPASKTIQKSESFFDKVDSPDAKKLKRSTNGKAKEKPNGAGKQTTLFGLMPPQNEKNQKKSRKADDGQQMCDPESQIELNTLDTDIPMSDAVTLDIGMSEDTLVASQIQDTQNQTQTQADSTQEAEESQETAGVDTVVDWPASPGRGDSVSLL